MVFIRFIAARSYREMAVGIAWVSFDAAHALTGDRPVGVAAVQLLDGGVARQKYGAKTTKKGGRAANVRYAFAARGVHPRASYERPVSLDIVRPNAIRDLYKLGGHRSAVTEDHDVVRILCGRSRASSQRPDVFLAVSELSSSGATLSDCVSPEWHRCGAIQRVRSHNRSLGEPPKPTGLTEA